MSNVAYGIFYRPIQYAYCRAGSVLVFGVGIGIFVGIFSCRLGIRYRYFEIPRYSVSISVFLKYWLKSNFWYTKPLFGDPVEGDPVGISENYTVSHKKVPLCFLIITLAFLGRLLYFLHQWKEEG